MKTAIVTGASRGIGRAIANELLNRGYYVISIARNFDNDTKTMQNQKCISLDLMKNSAIDELKAQIKDYDINTIIHNLGGKIN
ncbi:TPA: SDR family NAD(P)-dependent oxidoreductase [Campylobacter fetus]|nr:SDR family NAD(P)-dependent oxidoreductase [Campylobacter fetus]WKW17195.1 SDR family NAD(P)-dependent oxidoreductase [Campylobacter fetus subsp. fetus]EAJ5693533.1 SDR family NAD(P)-dependent oxidoreductase [Campylobacter fetus]EAJ5704631.1 SDR family NAD(P)-dependent oxidoreductase [Campylobacter fetus]EAJ9256357.1 SDR family NAD(P)-dependent oxidoreductase [Campylobacter fetus]EAK0815675.1 SDR family NAD(P)-dependent oxidoreductase [Campylobacter fetus]